MEDIHHRILAVTQLLARAFLWRHKDDDATRSGEPPLAVAPPRGLCDGGKPRKRTVDDGKVDVHSCLDKLRADDADGIAFRQHLPDVRNHPRTVFAAHGRRQVNRPLRHEVPQFAAVLARVDDTQHLFVRGKLRRDILPRPPRRQVDGKFIVRALQPRIQIERRRRDLPNTVQPGKIGLGRGRKHKCRSVMRGKFANRRDAWLEQLNWQKLNFIQDDDTLHHVVQFTATARLAGVKGFEELNRRRHDDRRIPVFRRKPRLLRFL